jgi:hypothetical protein
MNKAPILAVKPSLTTIYSSNIEYPPYFQNSYTEYEIKHAEIICAISMVYVIFPLLYTAYITNNVGVMFSIWNIIQSGIFDKIKKVKQYLSDKVAYMMHYLGYRTFSTYTVVKNGRELFTAYSEYINVRTTRQNIKFVDMAKYKVCKWIDAQCRQYESIHNEIPDVCDATNDIYDFIIHSSPDYKQSRVHRGDFRISTHTQFSVNYRTFSKLDHIDGYAQLNLALPSLRIFVTSAEEYNNTADTDEVTAEVIPIHIKDLDTFYIEKNELFDIPFLQWYFMNRLFRQDAADYIKRRRPGYEITLYNNDYETRKLSENVLLCKRGGEDGGEGEETDYFMKFTNGQHIIVGNSYIMKVDTVLNCPIYDDNNKCVISIDEDINDCYDDSDSNLTDDELSQPTPPVNIATVESVESEVDTESDTESEQEDTRVCNDDVDKMNIASEFEIIEDQD